MTETKVDAVLNFARNVFVDTALKVRGQLIVIIVIIMIIIIIKVSKLIKIVIFLILQCRTILDISSQKILESSTPPQQVNTFQMLSLQMSLVDNDKLIRHGSPHQCWSSSVAPCNSSTEGGWSFFKPHFDNWNQMVGVVQQGWQDVSGQGGRAGQTKCLA